ncbi:MAG: helix-turn-helix domain-containing protein [Clostridium sp.]|nr:helix-turn-helix domain-containing protein [Clostridium sp.]
MQNTLYFTAGEIEQMLGVSRAKAYKLVKDMNGELAAKGYIVIAGKIPKKFFAEKYYGLAL